jgi:hypothetical protein
MKGKGLGQQRGTRFERTSFFSKEKVREHDAMKETTMGTKAKEHTTL